MRKLLTTVVAALGLAALIATTLAGSALIAGISAIPVD
jgi:hypothetical protein